MILILVIKILNLIFWFKNWGVERGEFEFESVEIVLVRWIGVVGIGEYEDGGGEGEGERG